MAAQETTQERGGRIAFAVLVLAVATAAVVMAAGFPSATAARLPLLVGVPMMLLALGNLVAELRRPAERAADQVSQVLENLDESGDVEVNLGAFVDATPDSDDGLSLPTAFLAVALFAALYLVLGQLVAIPLGIALLLRMSKQSWKAVVITATATWVVIFAISTELRVQTHPGWIDLGEIVGRFFGA
jgi:hypothetical protein